MDAALHRGWFRGLLARAPAIFYYPAMKDETDLQALAARYLNLWEKQVAELSASPDLVRMLTGMLGAASAFGGKTMREGDASGESQRSGEDGRHSGKTEPADATGATSAAAAPRDSDGDLEQFSRRLADLEERVAALESAGGAGGGSTRRRSRRLPS